jgi:N-acetylglutamate synthase-like GNAT family acetyltransferase
MIRVLRPTDLLAYVTFCQRVAKSDAVIAEFLSPVMFRMLPTVARFLGRSLAVELGRETWVQIENGRISGLVAAKRREGADIWDVDELSLLPATDAERTGLRLLEQLLTAATDDGVHKVFLRLLEDDVAQEWVRQVGFFQYCRESTYWRAELPTLARVPKMVQMRRRRPADHQPLFQLYCSAVPFRVRQAEGMTLHEWRWTDGWAVRPVGLGTFVGHARVDWVVDGPSRPAAWLQVDHHRRRLSLLTDPQSDVDAGEIIRFGMTRLGAGGPARCAARDYQLAVAVALEDAGFVSAQRKEKLFARAIAARVPEFKLVPLRAPLS